MERSEIKARATKGRTLTEDEPSAAPDQTAGKQKPEHGNKQIYIKEIEAHEVYSSIESE